MTYTLSNAEIQTLKKVDKNLVAMVQGDLDAMTIRKTSKMITDLVDRITESDTYQRSLEK